MNQPRRLHSHSVELAAETSKPRPAQAAFRSDIQALRAFAVGVVLLNHLWPLRMPGGFIGVDIFFVISGFLISSHLLKTTLSGERLSLVSFYAKRIRRLLPAAFLVLFVSIIGVLTLLPVDQWRRHLTEIFAAAAYSENLYLTAQAVDYHALGQSATVAQHYWSLSVEEQFYFLWPLLLMGLAAFATRRGINRRVFTGIAITIFTAIFLAFSVWFTHISPSQAYFFTPVRFWEFGIGALVALGAPLWSLTCERPLVIRLRVLASLLGWITLIASAFLFSPEIPFPSATALIPVAGTALVIAAGTGVKLPVIDEVAALRPIRWMGDVSYSIYLWHWPLIVLAPALLRAPLSWKHKIVIAALTLILAGLTKPHVEDRGINSAWLAANNRRSFASMLTAVACFALLWGGLGQLQNYLVKLHEERVQAFLSSPCAGPLAFDPANGCTNLLDEPLSVVLGADADYHATPAECVLTETNQANDKFPGVTVCDYREDTDVPASSDDTIMLVGDSHAEQWQWPLKQIAQERKKRLEIVVAWGCPIHVLETEEEKSRQGDLFSEHCAKATDFIVDYVAHKAPQTIVYSLYAKKEPLPVPQGQSYEPQPRYNQALADLWAHWKNAGVENFRVIADTPYNDEVRDVQCFSQSSSPAQECRVPREKALGEDPLPGAAIALEDPNAQLIDFTNSFCDAQYCYAVAGQMPVFFDTTHLSRQYALKLVPRLAEQIP